MLNCENKFYIISDYEYVQRLVDNYVSCNWNDTSAEIRDERFKDFKTNKKLL